MIDFSHQGVYMSKFRWIREDIVLDFPLPRTLQNDIKEAEELDLAGNIEYACVADAIDVLCKDYVANGIFTKEQWDKVVEKYPYV